ncbi:aa3-type cytochrome c oxidase subunit IV [Ponticaulis sp.]|uniref:aa3-type cytochrome c oxidase subunit IV n=1 Tax=Ponticaulis sp. TaxID=2020902 RepID=UPI00260897E9|nr:aa3-type cytochrome c oxidase subunit IV [Ponticaulis sp.]MDF1680086.1 aa3-type cytochrome c oxidase subunit IV [Ponticaulis sp.]
MSDYVRGEMDITAQENTWKGFMAAFTWSSFLIVLVLAYAVFTITMGMNWLVAMGILAVAGIVGGLVMSMGSAWIVTVVGLCVFGVFLQIIITLAKAVL